MFLIRRPSLPFYADACKCLHFIYFNYLDNLLINYKQGCLNPWNINFPMQITALVIYSYIQKQYKYLSSSKEGHQSRILVNLKLIQVAFSVPLPQLLYQALQSWEGGRLSLRHLSTVESCLYHFFFKNFQSKHNYCPFKKYIKVLLLVNIWKFHRDVTALRESILIIENYTGGFQEASFFGASYWAKCYLQLLLSIADFQIYSFLIQMFCMSKVWICLHTVFWESNLIPQ